MSIVTIKHTRKSFREQQKALEEMFSLFPNATYELVCSSYNGRNYGGFEVYTKPEDFALIAHRCYVKTDDLFDFSRPKIIGDKSWTWNSHFIEIRFYWGKEYNFYYKDYRKTYSPISTSIQLNSREVKCGLKDWKKKYSYLLNLMNKNPNKKLVEKYRKEIQEVNKKVKEWEEAIKQVGQIKI